MSPFYHPNKSTTLMKIRKTQNLMKTLRPAGKLAFTQILVFPVSTPVDITAYQNEKCCIGDASR